jgi:hypothetical protein
LVLRTDFSDETAWKSICEAIRQPVGDFRAHVALVSDAEYDRATPEQLISLIPKGWDQTFMFVIDRLAISHPERPILVLDLDAEPGRAFRVIPSQLWGVQNNLSIANMDFGEFADAVGEDGIFRGFSEG